MPSNWNSSRKLHGVTLRLPSEPQIWRLIILPCVLKAIVLGKEFALQNLTWPNDVRRRSSSIAYLCSEWWGILRGDRPVMYVRPSQGRYLANYCCEFETEGWQWVVAWHIWLLTLGDSGSIVTRLQRFAVRFAAEEKCSFYFAKPRPAELPTISARQWVRKVKVALPAVRRHVVGVYSGVPGGGLGVQTPPEIPKFWQSWAEFPVPWKIHP